MKKLNELTIEEIKEITETLSIGQFKELVSNDNIDICIERATFYHFHLLLKDESKIEINVREN